jgi:hypothetical protein
MEALTVLFESLAPAPREAVEKVVAQIKRLEIEVAPAPSDLGTAALTVRSERRKAE